ncbi:MAG: recombinase RecA [bacterium]
MAKKVKQDETLAGSSKREVADLIISQIKASFGQGAIMRMNEVVDTKIDVISTGSLSVDLATGIGGLPRGRVIEIYGPEASGKTSLALSAVAQAQKSGGIAAFIDAEHALDPSRAASFGVNLNDLYISQPSNGEEGLEIVDNLVRSNAFDIVVVDSVAALVPKSELEGDMGDSSMGVQARLMSQALRKLTGVISKSKTTVIFINQLRLKIGISFGNPETTTGGQALKFYATQRFEVRKVGNLKSGTDSVGVRIKVKVVKNKLAAPFKTVEFDMIFDEPGVFSRAGEVLDVGTPYGVIDKKGNTYSFINTKGEEIKLGVGRESAKTNLYKNPELMDEATVLIMAKFRENIAKSFELKTTIPASDAGETEQEGAEIEE